MERLTAAADQQSGVRALDFEHERAPLAFFPYVGFRIDSHGFEKVVEKIGDGLLGLFVVLLGRLVAGWGIVRLHQRRLPIIISHHNRPNLLIGRVHDRLSFFRLFPLLSPSAFFSLFALPALLSLSALFPPSTFLPRSPVCPRSVLFALYTPFRLFSLVSPSTLPSLSALFLLSTLLPRSILFALSTPFRLFSLVSPSTLPSLSDLFLLFTLLPRSVLFALSTPFRLFSLVSPSTLPSLSDLFLLSTPFRLFSLVPRSALFLPASPPSSAAGSLRAVPILTRLRIFRFRACVVVVVVSGYRAFARQQPDFDLGRFTAETQNPGAAGINDGYFYVFELDAEGV